FRSLGSFPLRPISVSRTDLSFMSCFGLEAALSFGQIFALVSHWIWTLRHFELIFRVIALKLLWISYFWVFWSAFEYFG
ncbi:9806_t:CDS:2, partial [Funneliformis geosporum]